MGGFFTRDRFGRPQITAAFLLLAFLSQCSWLLSRRASRIPADEVSRIVIGRDQWLGKALAVTPQPADSAHLSPDLGMSPGEARAYDPNHSPLWYLVAAAPNALFTKVVRLDPFRFWGWLAALPFLIFGTLLGGSLWYVARRLYGNAGGYVALALYCFAPATIQASSLWLSQPETGAAWGAFGAVFTAIAVAHTLYAPREVVLWNWRRIVLLALSFALAVGSQFSLLIVVPVALSFMLYLAPTRRLAALAIWACACMLALLLLFASYFFHPGLFWQGLRHADYLPILWKAYAMPGAYHRVLSRTAESSPALLLAFPVAVIIYGAWRRSRYFGNTAPLLVSLLFLLLSVGTPHAAGIGFQLMAIPFLFVFVAGIAADLLESNHRGPVFACLAGLLFANALWNIWALVQAGPG
jgi:hypothetical protein